MNMMGNLQLFGRALMLPTIALPAAALLLSAGSLPWDNIGMDRLGEVLHLAGDSIFIFLPFIFAVGVALGLTANAETAGMSAMLSYFLCSEITKHYIDPSFQMGVLGGILIGVVTALAYHRFKNIIFPEYIQFFGGGRFVPLFMSFASILISYFFIAVGTHLQNAMVKISAALFGLEGFGTFLYGTMYRMLVPTGLHHILNNVLWFQIGSFERADGHMVYGDLPRYFAGDPTAGIYMAGLYPITMFALPAIALAIISEARKKDKSKVRLTFLTAALTCFLTGITEPIEFAFLFVAPFLFLIHSILSGAAMWIAYELGIHHGFSFSAGAIDFIINAHLATNGYLLIPLGLIFGLIYYILFRWAIRKFHLPTPGRELFSQEVDLGENIPSRAPLILQALGGKENIKEIEACITRLRLTLVDDKRIDATALRKLGAAGIIRLGAGNLQVVFGTFSELIREEIVKLYRVDIRSVIFHSPMQGKMIPLSEVPDQVFAQGIVGKGVAFIPELGEVVAPVHGTISHVFPSKHAIGISTPEGLDVLLHIGIDTSQLPDPNCFQVFVEEGDIVEPGQLLVVFDVQYVKEHAKSLASPLIVTNPEIIESWSMTPYKSVRKGQASVMSVVLEDDSMKGGSHHE